MKLAFVHYVRTNNTGDRVSAPYRYFDLGAGAPATVRDVNDEPPIADAVIYGGGALVPALRSSRHARRASEKRIAWGIGDTRHRESTPGALPGGFDLLGIRDWPAAPGAIWAPCVSCMAAFFDHAPAPMHEAVLYVNARLPGHRPGISDLPTGENTLTFAKAIAFLASGAVVVTNSYHGAYWAVLLGRKVIIAPAYSSKLRNFRHQPAIANNGDWRSAALHAPEFPEALAECRDATTAFADRVREVLA